MARYLGIFLWFLTVMVIEARSQDIYYIPHKASKILPEDLKTETLLFLKFDSLRMPAEKPNGITQAQYRRWKANDAKVQRANANLMTYVKKYPYKYKILSMNHLQEYKKQGAKYIFYVNNFESVTVDASYRRNDDSPSDDTRVGIIDLTSKENETSYFITRIPSTQIHNYKLTLTKLFKALEKQFGVNIQ
jgi:hypothetical protein